MGAPVSGQDLGTPFPPITNPNTVGVAATIPVVGNSAVSFVAPTSTALPSSNAVGKPLTPGAAPGLPNVIAPPTPTVKTQSSEILRPLASHKTVIADSTPPVGLETDSGRMATDGVVQGVGGRGNSAAATIGNPGPVGTDVDSGRVQTDGKRGGVGS